MPSEQSAESTGPEWLSGRALPGWMSRDEAVGFLTNECIFPAAMSEDDAVTLWEDRKRRVEELAPANGSALAPLPLTDADVKTIRKFRNRYPDEQMVVDFVKLNPLSLGVHQLWVSPAIAEKYEKTATPEKWVQTALLDPPSHTPTAVSRHANTILFDLPHEEFVLAGPPKNQFTLQVAEPRGFVTIVLHANRALLVGGYHRTFALAQYCRSAANAPRGVLFAVSNALEMLEHEADDIRALMELERPPLLADFFEPALYTAVRMKRRRYQMRVSFEVVQAEAAAAPKEGPPVGAVPGSLLQPPMRPSDPVSRKRAEAIFENAMELSQAGKLDDAIAAWERGLALAPDNAVAHVNIAEAFLQQSRLEAAADHARQALRLDPASPDAHTNLGAALDRLGRPDAAGLHFRQAVSIAPNHAVALRNLGRICSVEGDFPQALQHLRRAIRLRPEFAPAWHDLSFIHRFYPEDAELADLERLACRSDLSRRDAIYAHYAFGKGLEDAGDHRRAFEEYQRGAALKRSTIEYDEGANRERFQRVASSFDSALLERLHAAGHPSQTPVFIIGMPRSGTSLVEQLLASHPEVHGAGELETIGAIARASVSSTGGPETFSGLASFLTGDVLRNMAAEYLASLASGGKSRCVNKLPGNFLYTGLLHLMFPHARIIHTRRDPLDTCLSCYTTLFESGHPYSYEPGELGRYYNEYSALMKHWGSVMPSGSMLAVDYEELVADLEGQARRVVDYCGLVWDDRCLEFHRTKRPVQTASLGQVRRPLYSTSVGRAQRFEGLLEPLVSALKPLTAHARGG